MPSNRKRSSNYFSTRKEKNRKRNSAGKVVASDDGGEYYEVETILDYRKEKSVDQYLIKWVNYDEPTWESEEALCDSAYETAMSVKLAKRDSEFLSSTTIATEADVMVLDEMSNENEKETRISQSVEVYEVDMEPEQIDNSSEVDEVECIEYVEDKTIDWTETSQIEYRPIERVSVHEDGVAQRVKAAREAGVPLCLVGHVGWAQFAQPWLSKVPKGDANSDADERGNDTKPHSFNAAPTGNANSDADERGNDTKPHSFNTAPTGNVNSDADERGNDTKPHSFNAAPTGNANSDADERGIDTKPCSLNAEPTYKTRNDTDPCYFIAVPTDNAKPDANERKKDTKPCSLNAVPMKYEQRAKDPVQQEEKTFVPNGAQSPRGGDLLNLSDSYVVDVQKMIDCIGNESVPIQRKSDKLGDDPNQHRISLKFFLEKCWPEPGKELVPAMAARYLHQWQFPLSETAVPKLCNQCNPLPNGILGMDLLRLWHDREQFLGDSPYQYIFTGNKGTMSKLHSDRGGLMITIAPIVGEKEVVLVHRSDGSTSLYDLEGDLEKPDFHHYPLLPTARVWKTVVKPGEILIIPHSTYHQCRNLTPCLSYSRFYLDDVNMKGFLQSFTDRDALELDHADLLWNVCVELHTELTNYSDGVRKKWMLEGTVEEAPPSIVEIVSMLKKLRNTARHVEIHFIQTADSILADWKKMVLDIDSTLHNYRYRYFRKPPRITRRLCRHTREQQRDGTSSLTVPEVRAPLNCPLNLYCEQEKIAPEVEGTVVCDSIALNPGDQVGIKDHGYYFTGVIKEVRNDLKAAYVKFTELNDICSQYLPFDYLRSEVSDEALPSTFTPLNGSSVNYKESGRSYSARIQSWRCGTLYKLTIKLDQDQCFDRWFTRESFVSKISNVKERELHIV